MTAVEAVHLYKTYGTDSLKVEVLKDVTLKIEKGCFVSIMGPSGSGKSTFLYLAGGLDKPTAGKIFVNGGDLSSMKDGEESRLRRRSVGFVFQFYNLIPNLTVEENILLPALLDGKRREEYDARLSELLELTGLSGRRNHRPAQLSGGEQQRTAVARALINKPEIILADEPTGNLDTRTGTQILELFRTINRETGLTIVMVTHSAEAASFGDGIIRMMDGRLVAS